MFPIIRILTRVFLIEFHAISSPVCCSSSDWVCPVGYSVQWHLALRCDIVLLLLNDRHDQPVQRFTLSLS